MAEGLWFDEAGNSHTGGGRGGGRGGRSWPFGAGGGSGASCPLPGQSKPWASGILKAGASCTTCCPHPVNVALPAGALALPAVNDPCGNTGNEGFFEGWILVGAVAQVVGPSPLVLNYTANLAQPALQGRRIVGVYAIYNITVPGATLEDDGGSRSGSGTIVWGSGSTGLKLMTAFGRPSAYPVQCQATFPWPGATLSVSSIAVLPERPL